MKKICFILLALLLSFVASAQSPSAYGLVVQNQTNCTQYYYVVGDELCMCGGIYASNMIAIPPGGTHVYPNSTTLGGSFPTSVPKGIFAAKIPDGPMACATSGGAVGQAPCGLTTLYGYLALNATCAPCSYTKATWYPSFACSDMARLIFT
ncbi:MAG: hypothetical protein BGO31_01655 [Bacteroidetes bacterium 43-16]|nr:MAG: hypothetical protein BGO31_01655 [Bacteroidetes bacterium 43-16]